MGLEDRVVVCRLRTALGEAPGWATLGVPDPEASAGIRDLPSPSLLAWLGSLDCNPR